MSKFMKREFSRKFLRASPQLPTRGPTSPSFFLQLYFKLQAV